MRNLLLAVVVLTSLCLSVTAQDCPLPTQSEIENLLRPLLANSDGGSPSNFNPSIIGSVHYVCQAQGNVRDTYQAVSIIATFTPNPGQGQRTRIFEFICNSGPTWGDNGGLETPANGLINAPTRTDCFACRSTFGDDRCRECDSSCSDTGLGRCVGSEFACCSVFAPNGDCDTSCTSYGNNFIATESTNYTCTCNLTCTAGYSPNSNCTDCEFTDICERDMPCQNGGDCILLSAPANYTCNCANNYSGQNCSVCPLSCPAGYTGNSDCTNCTLSDICAAHNPCQNGGICTLQSAAPSDYSCDCSANGYTGINCSVCPLSCPDGYTVNNDCTDCLVSDICVAQNPCQNGAACILHSSPFDYTCNCVNHFNGDNCTECSLSCQNSGNITTNCSACICPIGYTGLTCNTRINYCAGDPCGIYGSCTNNLDGYSCSCREGWSGHNCRMCSIEFCTRCTSTPPVCEQCSEGYVLYEGRCQLRDLCHLRPCRNNGTCVGSPGSFSCRCDGEWTASSNCTQCRDGYGNRSNVCVQCSKDCLLCAENANQCTSCREEFEVSSTGQCISTKISTSLLIWIIVGCIIGALIVLIVVIFIVMSIVRCTGSYNEKKAHKKDSIKAPGNKVSTNPLYMSCEDLEKDDEQ